MRTVLIAFLLGVVAVGIAVSVAGLVLGIVAQSGGWASFRVALGPVVFLSFERHPHETSTTFGNGLFLLALAGGALNALGAALLRRRA
jgi:hypothetical protein